MTDAITCPDCGVNADTCRCDLRWPHTSAHLHEAAPLPPGLDWWYLLWWDNPPPPSTGFTRDAQGRLTLVTGEPLCSR